ncbi:MAG TPA: magnesium transporter [Fimbriimonadaceae bacterium]|nr:magnesium transporter [Fimbriimonadaceae bacterium]
MRTDEKTLVERLRSLAKIQNPEVVRQELEGVRAEDLAEAFQRMEVEEGMAVLQQLEADVAADVLVELPTEIARAYLSELPDTTLAHYLDILPMDDALDLREELPMERFEALLELIPDEDALEIRRLMQYPEDSAGRLMTEDFLEVGAEETMADVLQRIRETPEEEYEIVNEIYVLDPARHLLGVFTLREAIRANPESTAADAMNEDVVSVTAETSGEEVAREIARYGLYAMPVLDHRGRMLGIVTVDDAQEVLEQAETEDVLKMGGVGGDAEAYLSLGVWQLVKRRVPWLLALFVAESLTGNVLRYYGQGGDNELRLNPLAFFIPLLIGAGGNSGSQVTTTITRAIAIGEVRVEDWWRVMRREVLTAFLSGGILGAVGFLRAWLPVPVIGWGSSVALSMVVGCTLPSIVLWSTTIGSLLPIGAKRVGIDPAVMSAPFITTFVDATGLVIYFEIAKHLMGHL